MYVIRARKPKLPVWDAALEQYFDGKPDAATYALLGKTIIRD
jgi:hypothetical protein